MTPKFLTRKAGWAFCKLQKGLYTARRHVGYLTQALFFGLTLAASSAAVAQSVFDNAGNALTFTGGPTGSKVVGDTYTYTNVATIGGTRIDAKITVTAINNATLNAFDSTSNPYSSTTGAPFFQPNVDIDSVGGSVSFLVEFLNSSGSAVTLQNVYANTYDLDGANGATAGRQFTDFSGIASYALSTDTDVVRQVPSAGITRFITTVGGNDTTGPGTSTQNAIRARVFYSNISSTTITVGDNGATGLAYFALDFSQGFAFTTAANQAPVADAGADQSVSSAAAVTLDGSASRDPDAADTLSYTWTQTSGTAVTLSSTSSASPTFTAPTLASGASASELVFSLVVTDNKSPALSSVADTVRITVNAPTASAVSLANSTINASTSSILASGTSTSTITVQLKDASGNNLTASGGTLVLSTTLGTLGTVTDNLNGTYTVVLTSGTVSGTAVISGSLGGAALSNTVSVQFTAGPASASVSTISATPATIVATGATTSTVTVQLKDANGNNLSVSGGTVVLSTTLGTLGAVTDNNNGTYSATLTSGTVAGNAVISGTLAGAPMTDTETVVFTAGPVSATTSTITASPTSVAADGTSTSTITVRLKDANGNNLATSGGTVTLSTTLGTLSSVINRGDGTYTATLTSTTVGAAVISGTVAAANLTDTETVTFFNGPVLTGPNGSGGTTTGAAFAISLPEGGTAVTRILSNVTITTWALSGTDAARFSIANDGTIIFQAPTNFEAPVDADVNNIYVITISATDGAGNTVTRTLTVTITDVTLPGTPPAPGTDADGDGVADNLESSSADRDGDGIPDAQDYDPQGYFYCQADGRILPGGVVSVTGGPVGSNVTMVKDGSTTGEFQWFVDAPGTYTMAIDPSGTGYSTIAVASAGQLVLAAQSGNPIVIGHTQNAATGYLGAFNGVAYNPAALPTAYYTSFVIAEGDAYVFGNNIPMADCMLNTVTITKVTDASEPMGAALGQDGRFRVTLDRVVAANVIITFTISGTGSEGADYTTLTRSVTIPAGSLSADINVAVLSDSDDDSGETVIITLASVSNPAVTLGSVTSATVTLFDGLVEAIAERLTDVLQDDFNQTIALQSRQFASISRGALGRLRYMGIGWDCISTDDVDLAGDGAATDAASQLDATYLRERVDCARAERVLEYGALAVSAIDGQGAQMMLSFGRARETFEDGQINGRFWGGYLTTNGVDGDGADGRIAGVGANLGIYSARKLGSDLYLDTYAAAAIGYHGFDLMFDDTIRAEGDYGYIGVFAGAALSGEIAYDTATLQPRLGVDVGYGSAGQANVRAYTATASETGFVTIDPVVGLRAYAELGIVFGEQMSAQADQSGAPAGVLRSFGLTPRIFCENGFGTQNADCGYGLGVEFSEIEAARDIAWHMSLNAERVGDVTRGDMRISRERAFWHGAGTWSSGVTAGTAGDISAAHGVKVTW